MIRSFSTRKQHPTKSNNVRLEDYFLQNYKQGRIIVSELQPL